MNNESFKKVTEDLMTHCREQLGYDNDPDVHYVTDDANAESMLAKTAHYQPSNRTVTVYISKRHPKDILRSLAHELVHHSQNCRGDLDNIQTPEGYAQNDPHMRSMEEEAYLKGNMLFRDWSDGYTTQQAESKLNLIGENKMTEFKNIIKKKVLEVLKEAHAPGHRRARSVGAEHPLYRGKARAPGTISLDNVTNWVLEPSGRFHAEFELGGELQTMTGQLDADAMDLIGDMQSQQSYEKEVGLSPEEMQQGNPFRESIEEINMPLEVIEEIKNLDDNIERLMAQRDSLALEHGERPRYEGLVSEADDRIHEEEEEEEVEEAKKPDEDGDGVPDWADKKPGKDDHEDKKDEEVDEGKYGITTSPKHDQSMTGRPVQGKAAKKPKEKATGVGGKLPSGKKGFGGVYVDDSKDDKKPGKPRRVGKGDGKGNFSTVQDVNESKTTRFKEGDKVTHKDEDLGTGTVVSRDGNKVGVKWGSGQRSHDHGMLKKESVINELTEIRKHQGSIKKLNDIKNERLNEALMSKLLNKK